MIEKRYAFKGRFSKTFKIPVYITFDKIEVITLEDGSFEYKFEGSPQIFGRNRFYESILDLSIKWIIFYGKYLSSSNEDLGWWFCLDEIVEVED